MRLLKPYFIVGTRKRKRKRRKGGRLLYASASVKSTQESVAEHLHAWDRDDISSS